MLKSKFTKAVSAVLTLSLVLSTTVFAEKIDAPTQMPELSAGEKRIQSSDIDEEISIISEVTLEEGESENESSDEKIQDDAESELNIDDADESLESEVESSQNDVSKNPLEEDSSEPGDSLKDNEEVSESLDLDDSLAHYNIENEDLEKSILQIKEAAAYKLRYGTHEKYMSGYEDGNFRPEAKMKRSEFASLLYNLMDNAPDPVAGKFLDVKSGAWYEKAVNSMAAGGILSGDGDGRFRPEDAISRAEVVTILALITQSRETGKNPFSDVKSSHWAYGNIITASELSWISGHKDGTFKPDDGMKRCEIPPVINSILKRNDKDFAKDAGTNEKQFFDVQSSHWAHKDIMEAGERVKNPIIPQKKIIKTTTGVNFREGPSTGHKVITTLPKDTRLTVVDDTSFGEWIKASHATHGTGYLHSQYVTYVDEPTVGGNGVISATSANVALYKTLYITGNVSGSSSEWSSDNPAVAEVFAKSEDKTKGFIYGKSTGTTVIRLRDGAGNIKASCTVTVTEAEPVRFVYSNPNTPSTGKSFKLYALTDAAKSNVKFELSGPQNVTYETSSCKEEVKSASSVTPSIPENKVKVFEREITLNTPGEYTVKAYSKTSSGAWSTGYKSFTMLVVSDKDIYTTSTAKRSASHEMISVIANFEGTGSNAGEVYIDTLSSGYVPTVGYGYVVSKNNTFYNNLTKTEMMAMLSDTINNGNYVKNLQSFQQNNNVRMSQTQFDALVSFGYNLGTGYFKDGSNDTFTAFLNSMTTPSLPATAKVNVGNPKLFKQAGIGDNDGTIAKNSTVTVTEVKRVDGNVDNLWYKVSYNGKTGWIRGGHVRFTNVTTRDMAFADEQLFGSNLLQWNSAGGKRLPGLVYRRLGEAKIFCYGNYNDAYHTSSNYKKNVGFDVPQGVPGLKLE